MNQQPRIQSFYQKPTTLMGPKGKSLNVSKSTFPTKKHKQTKDMVW